METDIINRIKVPAGLSLVSVGNCHIEELSITMRQADKDEMTDCFKVSPREALLNSCMGPGWSVALLDAKDQVICIGGMGINILDDGTEVGTPWLLASDLVEKNRWGFLDLSKQLVAEMLSTHPTLFNICDVRNKAAHRWLTWLGFELAEPEDFEGSPVIPFFINMQKEV